MSIRFDENRGPHPRYSTGDRVVIDDFARNYTGVRGTIRCAPIDGSPYAVVPDELRFFDRDYIELWGVEMRKIEVLDELAELG